MNFDGLPSPNAIGAGVLAFQTALLLELVGAGTDPSAMSDGVRASIFCIPFAAMTGLSAIIAPPSRIKRTSAVAALCAGSIQLVGLAVDVGMPLWFVFTNLALIAGVVGLVLLGRHIANTEASAAEIDHYP